VFPNFLMKAIITNCETGNTINGGALKIPYQRKLHKIGILITFTTFPKQGRIGIIMLNYSRSNLFFYIPHIATFFACTRKVLCSNFGRDIKHS